MGANIIAVSTGDPGGQGPELVLKSFSDPLFSRKCIPLIVGDFAVLEEANMSMGLGISLCRLNKNTPIEDAGDVLPVLDMRRIEDPSLIFRKGPTEEGHRAGVEYLRKCAELGKAGIVKGVVTGPLGPMVPEKGLPAWSDQAELMAGMLGIKGHLSMFRADRLRVFPCTGPTLLKDALKSLSEELLTRTIVEAANCLSTIGAGEGRLAVASLNPCFSGLPGSCPEEDEILIPAIAESAARGVTVGGPFPGYGAFQKCLAGDFDGVITPYYDQAFLAVLSYDHMKAVKITFSLPFIHTSVLDGPDHENAWKGIANPSGMREAISECMSLLNYYSPYQSNNDQ